MVSLGKSRLLGLLKEIIMAPIEIKDNRDAMHELLSAFSALCTGPDGEPIEGSVHALQHLDNVIKYMMNRKA